MKGKKRNKLEEKFEILNSMPLEKIEKMANQYDIISFEKLQEKEEERRITPIEKQIEKVELKLEIANKSVKHIKELDEQGKKMIEISNLQKEKETLIKQKDEIKKDIEREIKDHKKDKEFIENYLKNKEKIIQVRKYKDKLVQKSEKLQEDKKVYSEKMKLLEGQNKENLDKLIAKQEEIEEKLKNSENMTNPEYNNCLIDKQKIEEKIEEEKKKQAEELRKLKTKIKEIDQNIIGTSQAISKCDMVWKNLFLGKSWDDINLKALQMNEQRIEKGPKQTFFSKIKTAVSKYREYTKDISESILEEDVDEKSMPEEKSDKKNNKEEQIITTEIVKEEEEENTQSIETDMSFLSRHPKLAGIFNKIKSIFSGKNKTKELPNPEQQYKKSNDKDAFVEKLKVMIDREEDKRKDEENIEQMRQEMLNKGDREGR